MTSGGDETMVETTTGRSDPAARLVAFLTATPMTVAGRDGVAD